MAEAIAGHLVPAPRRLSRGLRRLRRRVRLVLAVRFATLATALLAGMCVPLVVLAKLRAFWYPPLLPELALVGGIAVSALLALAWPLPDGLLAASADRRLSLRDRLVTALGLVRAPSCTGMEQAAVADALEHIARLQPRAAFPFRVTRATKVAGLCLVLMGGAQFTPLPAWLVPPREREDRASLRREAARIMPVAKKLEEEGKRQGDASAQDIAKRLQRLAKDLDRGRLDKKQALVKLDQADKELQKAADRLAPQPPKTAEQAAREMQDAAARKLAEKAEQLAQKAAQRGDRKAEEQFRKLAEQARKPNSGEQLKRLAEQLNRMAGKDAAKGVPVGTMPSLSIALSEKDWEKLKSLLNDLQNMPEDMTPEELAQMEKDLREIAKALEKSDLDELAKELCKAAEECKNCKGGKPGKAAKAALAKALKAARAKFGKLKLAKACQACQGGQYGYGTGPGDSQGQYDPNAPGAGLFDPRETQTDGKLTRLPSQINPSGTMLTVPTTDPGAPDKVSASRVPYYEVIGNYSKSAEEALSKEEVPPGYRPTVRKYFKSLQPDNK